jgi:hypothetical protein
MGKAISVRAEGSGREAEHARLRTFLRPFLKLSPVPM